MNLSEQNNEKQNNFSEESLIGKQKIFLNYNQIKTDQHEINVNNNYIAESSEIAIESLIDEIEVFDNDIITISNEDIEFDEGNNKTYFTLNQNNISTSTVTTANELITDLKSSEILDIPHIIKYIQREGKQIKIWVCGICDRNFQHQYTLSRHLPTHTNIRNFVCSECGKAFRQLSTLSQHKAIHSIDRPYACETCNKSFNRISTLISHRKTHSEIKPYQCHMCHKGFHQKGNLRNHIFIHTNERPYRCSFCNKGFNQMSNLVCHKQKSHATESHAIWSCHRCTMSFNKRNLLRAHELEVHQIHETPKSTKKQGMKRKREQKSIVADNAILIPLIETDAMKIAKLKNEIPFAVLHFIEGTPLLVRVIDHGLQSLLRPAKREDFCALKANRKHEMDKISIPIVASVQQILNAAGVPEFDISQPKNIYKLMKNFEQQIAELNFDNENIEKEKAVINKDGDYCLSIQSQVQSEPIKNKQKIKDQKSIKTEKITSNQTLKKKFTNNKNLPKAIAITEQQDWWKNNQTENKESYELSETFKNIATSALLAPKQEVKEDVFLDSQPHLESPELLDLTAAATNHQELSNILEAMKSDDIIETMKQIFTENGIFCSDFI